MRCRTQRACASAVCRRRRLERFLTFLVKRRKERLGGSKQGGGVRRQLRGSSLPRCPARGPPPEGRLHRGSWGAVAAAWRCAVQCEQRTAIGPCDRRVPLTSRRQQRCRRALPTQAAVVVAPGCAAGHSVRARLPSGVCKELSCLGGTVWRNNRSGTHGRFRVAISTRRRISMLRRPPRVAAVFGRCPRGSCRWWLSVRA